MEKLVHNHGRHVYVTSKNCQNNYHKVSEHPEDWFSTNSIIPSANSLKVLAVVTAAGKSEISASFLRVDVRDGVGSKIFNNCNLLPWYSCCFYVKHSGRPVIFILRTAAQREGRNNPTVLIC